MTPRQLNNKIRRLSQAQLDWEDKGNDWQLSDRQQDRARAKALACEERIETICAGVSRELFEESRIGTEILCADWEDYQ